MQVPVSGGLTALVDGEDFSRVAAVKWSARKGLYATYAYRAAGGRVWISMHRDILAISDSTRRARAKRER